MSVPPGLSRSIKIWLRHPSLLLGTLLAAGLVFTALLAPALAPSDPSDGDFLHILEPPGTVLTGQARSWLGTDELGRDVLSRLMYGSRITLRIGFLCVAISLLGGGLAGFLAGYIGGWIDQGLMRLMDLMLAFPSILLAIVIVAVMGPSLENAIIAVAIIGIPQYARLVRAVVLEEREKEYVQAARALGARDLRIMAVTILPNVLSPIMVQVTLGFATAILDAAGLSFLGLGAQPPTPEWGAMLHDGMPSFRTAAWVVMAPGSAIFLTVLGLNLLGDGLRDLLDPRLRGR